MGKTIIAALWIWTVAVALWDGLWRQPDLAAPQFPVNALPIIVALPVVVFGLAAIFAKQSPFYAPMVARWIDARTGAGSYESFLVRLKPLLMFATGAFLSSGIAMLRAMSRAAPGEAYVEPSFFLSAAAALATMHLILRRKGATGV